MPGPCRRPAADYAARREEERLALCSAADQAPLPLFVMTLLLPGEALRGGRAQRVSQMRLAPALQMCLAPVLCKACTARICLLPRSCHP